MSSSSSITHETKDKDFFESKDAKVLPPDSPKGWVVVFGAFFLLMMVVGNTNAFGVFMEEYQLRVFPTTPSSTISWIGSLQFCCMCIFGVGTGILIERFRPQLIILIGAVATGTSLLIASACNSPIPLIFTQGILFGASGSLLLIPSMSLPGQWMQKHRALAIGVCAAGGSLGGLWMSFATKAIVSKLGWQWALRINGIMVVVVGASISPLMRRRINVPKRDKIIDVLALKNIHFILLFAAGMCAAGGYYMPYYFMPSFSVVVLGLPSKWSANISSLLNAGSVVGRIATGILADHIGSLNALFLTSLLSAFAVLVLWLPFKTLGTLIAAALVFGFASGSIVSLVPVVTADLFGIKRLPSILGLVFFSYAIGTLISSPIGGVLLDVYGHETNYTSLIIYNGVFFALSTVLLAALRLMRNRNLFAKV
ncbi:hypothetical protein GGI25_002061 [Coemansia spiralis]|uniref:Major facilitator superfamily (MFS) profile domain-containing protein n=2 Tax=Coemansia TaxID=4863 RepID=A0A9W8GBK3_9FUNG|nr:major facilitator superfamily domain-containing protein [Coemansia spiralis]KAJ1992731.1 hypothetical protein EDC05_002675 [Coemansia umbellata]KAJ2623317.1 hypothetical protein GGI26_002545 [Coemansia sp. RSA 1358]KAJ2678868.1 hypothetical protein GGI25_002061 [Coemansia spiralis]